MKPSPPNPELAGSVAALPDTAATGAPETVFTRRDLLSALGVGLGIAVVAAVLAYVASRREMAEGMSHALDHPRKLVAFNLTDRSGRSVTQADLLGKSLVVNFVFTSCSLSCRAVNDRMEEIQPLLAGRSDTQLVSLTVDPRTDTPAVLARFAEEFHADTNRWFFLTGEKSVLYDLIETSFVPRTLDLEQLIPGGFTATDRIMLVDPDGTVRTSFNGLKPGVAAAVAAEIENHHTPRHTP